jgi:hypothetical protein
MPEVIGEICNKYANFPPGTVFARHLFVISITQPHLTKEKPPLRVAVQYIVKALSDGHNDPAIVEGYSSRFTLRKTEERNRKADKLIHLANLLNLVGTCIANLGSGTPTGTRLVIAKEIGAERHKGRLCFRLACEEITSTVKRSCGNLRTRSIVKAGYSLHTLRQCQKSDSLSGNTDLAGGGSVGHCLVLQAALSSIGGAANPSDAPTISDHIERSSIASPEITDHYDGDHIDLPCK